MIWPIGSPSAFAALFTTMSTPPSWSTVVVDQRFELVEVAGVGRAPRSPGRRRPRSPSATCVARVGLAARDHDRGAGGGERLRDRPADAAAAAGDDRDPTGEVVARLELVSGSHRHVAHVTRLLESLSMSPMTARGAAVGASARRIALGAQGFGVPRPTRSGRPPPRAPGARSRRAHPDRLGERDRPLAGAAALRPARPAPARPAHRHGRGRRAVRVLGSRGVAAPGRAVPAAAGGAWRRRARRPRVGAA